MANQVKHCIVACVFALLASHAALAAPVITGINKTEAPLSGRVAISGSGFGTIGEVRIAGLSAWTTTWNDGRVVAYVPEAAALGPTTVHVVSQGAESNRFDLTVTAR